MGAHLIRKRMPHRRAKIFLPYPLLIKRTCLCSSNHCRLEFSVHRFRPYSGVRTVKYRNRTGKYTDFSTGVLTCTVMRPPASDSGRDHSLAVIIVLSSITRSQAHPFCSYPFVTTSVLRARCVGLTCERRSHYTRKEDIRYRPHLKDDCAIRHFSFLMSCPFALCECEDHSQLNMSIFVRIWLQGFFRLKREAKREGGVFTSSTYRRRFSFS